MKNALIAAALFLAGAGCLTTETDVASFEDCVAAGNPVMESYPRQCRADGKTFVEAVALPPEPSPEPAPEPSPEPQPEPVPEGAHLLRTGETVTLDGGFSVTLTGIDDSRCPKDVQCVWAGELAAVLTVTQTGPDGGTLELRLGQITSAMGAAFGRTVELKAVTETSATIVVTP